MPNEISKVTRVPRLDSAPDDRQLAFPTLHVNADDFGLHPDIDRGILACVDAGRVTGVSVCATVANIDWTVVQSLVDRGIDVGVHVTLVGELWITRPTTFASWSRLAPWLLVPGRRGLLEAEVRAQIERFAANGVRPTHLDSHQHVHVLPTIWPTVTTLAQDYGIGRIRVPATPDRRIAKRSIAGAVLQRLSEKRSVATSLPCIGIACAGHNTAARLVEELTAADGAHVELVAHPGIDTPALQAHYADWHFDWKTEQAALLSDEWGEAVGRLGYVFAPPKMQ